MANHDANLIAMSLSSYQIKWVAQARQQQPAICKRLFGSILKCPSAHKLRYVILLKEHHVKLKYRNRLLDRQFGYQESVKKDRITHTELEYVNQ